MTLKEYLASRAKADAAGEVLFERMSEFQIRLGQRVADLMGELNVTAGKVDATPANVETISAILSSFDSEFADEQWIDAVTEYLGAYDGIEQGVVDYARTLGTVNPDVVTAIKVTFKGVLSEYLTTASSFRADIHIPLANAVAAYVSDGEGSFRDLVKFAQDTVTGGGNSDGAILGHAKTAVNDMVSVYERTSMQAATAKVGGALFYLYQGKPIDTTRPFCRAREGHVWHETEVRGWGDLEPWAGWMEGTNTSTIFQFLGGYNCRHVLVPLAKRDVPPADLSRMKAAGLQV
jgi:hypothetical protein